MSVIQFVLKNYLKYLFKEFNYILNDRLVSLNKKITHYYPTNI